jgi:L-Ala-D/L-Glu epimerase / N-acetyl-D-glutamate racemase
VKIESAELHLVRIPFKGAFQHALKRRTEAETIIVVVRSVAGAIGIGEIAPRPYLTGETIEDVLERTAPARASRFIGKTLSSREETVEWLRAELDAAGRDLATLAGFELAILDAAGKELGFAAGDVLGGSVGPELPPGVVIGFEVATPDLKKHCAMLRFVGSKHVKVKVGQADDLERIEIISRSLGAALPLRLDANGIWSADEAIGRLRAMRDRFNIASIEQPIASSDLEGARRVRAETGVKVMADESLCTLEDGRRLIAAEAADIFNIRIGKCGGLLGSLRLVELARQAGLGLHLGALVGETAVLTRAAEIFGRRVPGFECLEGKGQNTFLLQGDIAQEVQAGTGLGVEINQSGLARYQQRRQQLSSSRAVV